VAQLREAMEAVASGRPWKGGAACRQQCFFLFCLITKFCYVLWLPMTLHSIHFAQYALVDEFNSECSPVSKSSVIEIDLFCVFPVYTNFLCSLFVARYHYFEVLCTCLRLLFKGWITMFHDISSV